jgi:hypothetical protein
MAGRVSSSSPEFKRIKFGYASAEKESAESPDLLVSGYFDLHDACSSAAHGPEFLFLGYKGSGKSAIGERLRLINEARHDVFINAIYLEDFPFTTFSKIIRGSDEPEAKYPTAWSWILLIYLLDSFSMDAALTLPDPVAFHDTVGLSGRWGLPRTPIYDTSSTRRRKRPSNLLFQMCLSMAGKRALETRPPRYRILLKVCGG